ncbi:MAG: Cyclic di-GMP phosphodiesterase Gmr [Candidatus Accumulibacter appositus]|uniref:Cyclic di-GMP phosphodiesterase Gmr n=1 Tax=Candidatus Accumulibacter appositus TaxID=1454003 RepID=A0A011Q1U2_9PROT|nr:diguanylate cyclase [Accumulibacter sp.]EXI83140.1 MAG: Cyclic di-GMP phosphodiesterase Gmr [Candidatus Accumulibacter appositus]HRF04502.1 diguanylate cyclase [Accumulibacter sp.]
MKKPTRRQISILVIEDDPGDLGLIRTNVRLAGLRSIGEDDPVIWAATLADGMAATARKPDVILLDLSLPDSSGIATVEAMRAMVPSVPIIVLTGQDDHQLAEAALHAGAQDYLGKGQLFQQDALGRAIRHALVRQKLETRLRLFDAALNAVASGIVITDVTSTIEWANPAFAEITGYAMSEVVGRDPGEVLNSGKQDGRFYQGMWQTILTGKVWTGELVNRRKNGSFFDAALTISPVTGSDGHIHHFVAVMQDISARKATDERVQHLAHHDQLTDLPNRMLLSDRLFQSLAQVRREQGTLAVMFLDLDDFKPVNDTLGHDIGDLLLKEVALRLRGCAPRDSDTVARLGGDEFVILLAQIEKAADAAVVARKILTAVKRPFVIGPHRIEISTSIGIAVYPEHGDDVNRLLKNADTAMYHAKKAGRGCYRFFRELTETTRA